jgi:fluoride exporter
VRARDLALVSAGGAVGALARYGLSDAFPTEPGRFPVTTFAINVSGAFVLGALLEWLVRHRSIDHWARFFAGVGVLGAFTTFSTFATETVVLTRDGHGATAAVYVVTSVLAGTAAVLAGLVAAGWRRPPVPAEGES